MIAADRRLVDYLEHIVQSIDRIARYIKDTDELSFLQNEMLQDAVVHNLVVIGEASRNLETRYPAFVAAHPDMPLTAAYQMRNAVVHGYFKVDFEIVWRTIQTDLPGLGMQARNAVLALNSV